MGTKDKIAVNDNPIKNKIPTIVRSENFIYIFFKRTGYSDFHSYSKKTIELLKSMTIY